MHCSERWAIDQERLRLNVMPFCGVGSMLCLFAGLAQCYAILRGWLNVMPFCGFGFSRISGLIGVVT